MKDALMLAVQITPEERAASKEIARKMGMTYAGWMGFLIKRELKNAGFSSEDSVNMPDGFSLYGSAGDIKGNAVL